MISIKDGTLTWWLLRHGTRSVAATSGADRCSTTSTQREETISKSLIALAALLPLAWGCAQHSQAWDDARAQCEAESIEQMETAGVDHDQRATWRENYIRECMQKKGFEE